MQRESRFELRMLSALHRRVLATIREQRMIAAGNRVGVAVSGGADSVALLRLFCELQSKLGITLLVLHLNHGLRGEDSTRDEEFVSALAQGVPLECEVSREDVAALARRNHWNLEDAGRRARSRFFERVVEQGRCNVVAVAQTADDQAETVLARILRGSGPRGLVGIHPIRGVVVRPLLEVRRDQLREYLQSKEQTWREDVSNRDVTRTRARIRHQLLPQLERDFNPAIVERLANLAGMFRKDEAFWDAFVADRLTAFCGEIPGGLLLSVADLLSPLPFIEPRGFRAASTPRQMSPAMAVSNRLALGALHRAAGEEAEFNSRHVEQVLRLAERSQSGRELRLPHGVRVMRVFDRLEFMEDVFSRHRISGQTRASKPVPYEYSMPAPARTIEPIDVPELGMRVGLKVIDWPQASRDTKYGVFALDADSLVPPLVLRSWHPGDALRLPGKRQAQKVKRLFSAGRVGIRERATWPVLTSAGRIAWVRGWPPATEFLAGSRTQRGVVVIEEGM